MSATLPDTTRRGRTVPVKAPRATFAGSAPRRRSPSRGNLSARLAKPTSRARPEQRDADLFRADRRHIGLFAFGPVDFDEIRPRFDAKVHAQADAAAVLPDGSHPGQTTGLGVDAIGADDPAAFDEAIADANALRLDSRRLLPPQGRHAGGLCVLHEKLVQPRAADSDAGFLGEGGLGDVPVIQEADSAKRRALLGVEPDAQPAQRRDAIRHQALAARLVDRRNAAIHHADVELRRDGRRAPRPDRRDRRR